MTLTASFHALLTFVTVCECSQGKCRRDNMKSLVARASSTILCRCTARHDITRRGLHLLDKVADVCNVYSNLNLAVGQLPRTQRIINISAA